MEAGSKLGHFEILEPPGAGGMAEVYRARDTKLDRVLPSLPRGSSFRERRSATRFAP